jgi:hypothetical protein
VLALARLRLVGCLEVLLVLVVCSVWVVRLADARRGGILIKIILEGERG